MFQCQCKRNFRTKLSRRNHRRFCEQFQVYKNKRKEIEEKNKNFICSICCKKYKDKKELSKHYFKDKNIDLEHKNFYLKQKQIAINGFKNGLSQYDIIEQGLFVFGSKRLWIIWREQFNEDEIKKVRKTNKYKRRKFICKNCKSAFVQRQTKGICPSCLKIYRRKREKKLLNCKCKNCGKAIKSNKTGFCVYCLRYSKKGKKILQNIYKGINKGNPGWARVKKINNYIEERTARKLRKLGFQIECQKRIGRNRVDIFLKDYMIILECDGRQHYEIKEHYEKDKIRDRKLIKQNFRIIRFNALCINLFLDRLVIEINKFIKKNKKRQLIYLDKNGKRIK